MSVGFYECSLNYLPVFLIFQMLLLTWKHLFLLSIIAIKVFLRTGGQNECPFSQYFVFPFLIFKFPRFSAATSPAKLVLCSQVHNCCGEPGDCCCAEPCNPDYWIQDSTKGLLSCWAFEAQSKIQNANRLSSLPFLVTLKNIV